MKENKFGHAEQVYKGIIKRRVKPELTTFNVLISGLCKAAKLNKAGDFFEDIKAWGLSPIVVIYNTLIDGYRKKGKAGRMYKVQAILKSQIQFVKSNFHSPIMLRCMFPCCP